MKPSPKELAQRLDRWADERRAFLTEAGAAVVVGGLSAADAAALAADTNGSDWEPVIEDGAESIVAPEAIHEDFAPFKIILKKPDAPATVAIVLTNHGLADWLSRIPTNKVLWVAQLEAAFETYQVRFAPWDDNTEFQPIPSQPTARKLVRENGQGSQVPSNLGPWLLKEESSLPWDDKAAQVWINLSAAALFRSLSNEVEADGDLMFRGPPVVRYSLVLPVANRLSPSGFGALQAAARWVFEVERDQETRHGLLAAELARTNVGGTDASILFDKGAAPALEGAKIALQLGLQKLSLDSLKAMADLRKAITDEASKLSEVTRQLAAAVAGALFAGIGVIAARLTVAVNGPVVVGAILILGIVLFGYVLAVIVSGMQFVRIQRELRSQWRDRLYRFLPETEYKSMVTIPAAKAESSFKTAAFIGGILAVLLLVAVVIAAFVPGLPPSSTGSAAQATASTQVGGMPTDARSTPSPAGDVAAGAAGQSGKGGQSPTSEGNKAEPIETLSKAPAKQGGDNGGQSGAGDMKTGPSDRGHSAPGK